MARREIMRFDVIAFDADDTLWQSEVFYQDSQSALATLLAAYGVSREAALDTLHRIEIANLASFGFGIKGFTISMVEAAIDATSGQVSTADIRAIIDLGKAMSGHELRLLDNCAEIVAKLAESHRLMLITKGDLMDQERKIAASGLASNFWRVEIVSDKSPEAYASLLRKEDLNPERFLMVGNSMRSDILPVLEIGGWAVYVPHELTWRHENSAAPAANRRYYEIEHLGLLPELIGKIESGA
jgi:putative hydrolase of the HAD superfamily